MPNQPKTPLRSFRIDDDTWQRARTRAEREGTTVTAVIVERLTEYANEDEDRAPED